jgi:hypothetical protein
VSRASVEALQIHRLKQGKVCDLQERYNMWDEAFVHCVFLTEVNDATVQMWIEAYIEDVGSFDMLGSQTGWSLLHQAANADCGVAIVALIRHGANPNIITGLNIMGKTTRGTPLHIAANQSNIEAARALVNNGAIIDSLNRRGNTPFLFCITECYDRSLPFLKALYTMGADVHAVYGDGGSAMDEVLPRKDKIPQIYAFCKGLNITPQHSPESRNFMQSIMCNPELVKGMSGGVLPQEYLDYQKNLRIEELITSSDPNKRRKGFWEMVRGRGKWNEESIARMPISEVDKLLGVEHD